MKGGSPPKKRHMRSLPPLALHPQVAERILGIGNVVIPGFRFASVRLRVLEPVAHSSAESQNGLQTGMPPGRCLQVSQDAQQYTVPLPMS